MVNEITVCSGPLRSTTSPAPFAAHGMKTVKLISVVSFSSTAALAGAIKIASTAATHIAAELTVVLSQARKRDALTLWHLLSRVDESERSRVYDRLALLDPPPPHVTRAGVLRLDRQMLDLWWNELNLGDMSLWRTWERSWPEDK